MEPRVIAYGRLSRQTQAEGAGAVRQQDLALQWCIDKKRTLDESLEDIGFSAFRGKNKTKGTLARFLKAVEDGRVPRGSYLLVEHFDRLSREEISDAQDLVKSILKAGITIVTLLDNNREYTEASLGDLGSLLTMIVMFARAHEESLRKGQRVADRFARDRDSGVRVFGTAPGWLKRVEGSEKREWEVIEEKAAVVRKVFELCKKGVGGPSIARIANKEGWPVPTRQTKKSKAHWHAKMPQILLNNEAVIGRMEFWLNNKAARDLARNDTGHSSNIVVEDYYPAIIDRDLWHSARSEMSSRKKGGPKRDTHYFNVFSGLMRCGHCGATLQRKAENRGQSRAQLTCNNKLAGLTKCKTMSALKTEPAVLRDICAFAGASLGLGYDKEAAAQEIEVARSKLSDVSKKLKNLVDLVAVSGPIKELTQSIGALTKERGELEDLIDERTELLKTEPGSMLDTSYADGVLEKLYEESDDAKLMRADCNARLRRAVDAIWVWAYDIVIVQFKYLPEALTVVLPTKAQGDKRPAFEASMKGELKLPTITQ